MENNEQEQIAEQAGEKKAKPRRPRKKPENNIEAVETDTLESVIFGRNSVIEAMKAGRCIDKILIQKGDTEGSIVKIINDAKKSGIVVQEVEKAKLDALTNHEKHQGVFAYVAAHRYYALDEIMNDAKSKAEDPFVLILESIQDPQNLGAIIRTALNAGVHGIIIPKHRAVGLSAAVQKASAGAVEYMKVCKVTNIAQTIETLKSAGVWVACADMDGEIIYRENLKGPIGIVIGNEGGGVSKNVKSKCDFVVSIPMFGKIQSLNASVAAAVVCYEVVRQRRY
ncbi:23S rRNA (guanosine(2251)-2'-O)-methyltransferase RlmB [Candidatus Epulonipiscium viviparus]|uniref:23S rRNA (guanosine(2251)-2'-O)-methyltransferase RlmB n=1 Tax=Candidatus Epulonipiscium viviparus TaxID=420336 RepID=UPI0027380ADE|nr:23S rRNA (guanosine(2251)-2'-O)-methyltransferase RlmB [Candidatus Epulopiscium viviparus]